MKCLYCENDITINSNFCNYCGKQISKDCIIEDVNILNDFKPNEIAFLNYINGSRKNAYIPDYWKFFLGINVTTIFDKFLKFDLITCEYDPKLSLKKKTIPELKEILKKYELSVTGKKEILIDRIINKIDPEILNKKLNNQHFYKITEKGKYVINKYYLFVINIKDQYYFSDKDMLNTYSNLPNENNVNNLIVYTLNNLISQNIKDNKWGLVQTNIYKLANLYFKNDNYLSALKYYIIDFKLLLYNMQNDNYLNNVSNIYISEHHLKELRSIINITNVNKDTLLEYIKDDNFTITIPFKYFNDNEILKILCDLLDGKKFDAKNYLINKPNKNSSIYKYYGFDDEKNAIFSKSNTSSNNTTFNFIDKLKSILK